MKFFFIAAIVLFAIWLIKKENLNLQFNRKTTLFALVMDSVIFCDFYFNYIHDEFPIAIKSIISRFFSTPDLYSAFGFFFGIVVCVIGFSGVCFFCNKLINYFKSIYATIVVYKKHFFALLCVNMIAFLSIIRANFYYIDDLGRTIEGYNITGSFFRYTASFFAEILHGNSWLADSSPLPQLVAVVVISLAEIVILSVFSFEKLPKLYGIIAVIPIGLNPYFLSCLSYRYDAPYMALSILASVVPFVFHQKNKELLISTFLGTLIMCTTYQVSSGIIPMLAVSLVFFLWMNNQSIKKIAIFSVNAAASYLLGLVVFKYIICSPITDSYVDTNISATSFFGNVKTFFSYLNTDFPFIWKALIILIVISFIVYMISNTKINKIKTVLFSIPYIIVLFLLSFGVYLFFGSPQTNPRAFYGVGLFVSVLGIPLVNCKKNYLGKAAVLCLCNMFVVFALIYGNALYLQNEYTHFRTEQVIDELNAMELLDKKDDFEFQIIGTIGQQTAVRHYTREYPIMERLVPILFADSTEWNWSAYHFSEYYGLNAKLLDYSQVDMNDYQSLKDTYYYSIYSDGNSIIIVLNDVESKEGTHGRNAEQ